MTRRNLLVWACRTLSTICAAVIAVPGFRYLIDPLRKHKPVEKDFKRVIHLDALPVDTPREFAVRDAKQDAWTSYPEDIIGRVWIVRRSQPDTPPDAVQLDVYSTTCPHLGCAIQYDSRNTQFTCPCHKASFRIAGQRVADKELGHRNPSPRSMDSIEYRVVQDDTTQRWWVEVRYQKFRQGLTEKVPTA